MDYHSLFFSTVPEALTQLGAALRFYGVSFRYAPTPQAKGKIERDHQCWQNRLPAYFASEGDPRIDRGQSPIASAGAARASQPPRDPSRTGHDGASRVGSSAPREAQRAAAGAALSMVAVCLESAHCRSAWETMVVCPSGHTGSRGSGAPHRVILCQHPSGHHSVLAQPPDPKAKPVVLFTNQPTSR